MTYSRSRTLNVKKTKKRNRTRALLALNGILLCAIVAVAIAVWKSKDGNGAADGPSREPAATSSPQPSGSAPADSGSDDGRPASEENGDGEESASPASADGAIKLAFVGDVLPAAKVLELMKINGYDYPFREAKELLSSADIAAGNLETPISERGIPAENKQFVFRGSAEAVPELKNAGFDFFSLANNHTLDYGWDGLSDTMDALDDAGLQHAGSGNDDREAYAPAYIEKNGTTVGFVSVTRVVPEVAWKAERNHPGVAEAYSPQRAVQAIMEAKENADIVVVMVHWGVERADKPVEHQTDLAHRFVDAGADLVIGSHPHVLQGFEAYKGKWIAYSLGNFVFSTTTSPKTSETGVLSAACDKDGACKLSFAPMFAKQSQPAPMEEPEGKALLARLSELSYGAAVGEDGAIVAKN
ncbi:CapA family protein [Cohnella suwonensis]|uniref:CapA family protein n=1 Tax=Cohnella suwonensis TaxID=696072 RepID=A0ABW0M341_9BACL